MQKIILQGLLLSITLCNGLLPKKITIKPVQNCTSKVIIFDLGDVLLKTSKGTLAAAFIPTTLFHPSVISTMVNLNIKKELFAVLSEIPTTTQCHQIMYSHGEILPPIWTNWMIGNGTADKLYHDAFNYINDSEHHINKKRILSKIIQTVFNPQKLAKSQKIIKPMLKLLYKLKNQGYKLYVLSNWDKESFPLLKKRFQHFFDLFDGIMISGQEGVGKPSPQIYTKLLQKYNLKASECIFIDDEPHNVTSAQNLGMKTILQTSPEEAHKKLHYLGVIIS